DVGRGRRGVVHGHIIGPLGTWLRSAPTEPDRHGRLRRFSDEGLRRFSIERGRRGRAVGEQGRELLTAWRIVSYGGGQWWRWEDPPGGRGGKGLPRASAAKSSAGG